MNVEKLEPNLVKSMARFLGVAEEPRMLGLIEREARSRGYGHVVCSCGSGPASNEMPDGGLYLAEDGSLRRVCGSCWLKCMVESPVDGGEQSL